ncbi:actin cytoskeleton-regulatory complex protein PAN1 [Drosophila simulans]|uniref:actin cytoskeleton-regulatory complex protein PAN1 n=1 Tax=Drosophila simulans TaxID=7240 RepID=UPI00078AEF53|nr:actin cytoskeleton-regulatory complex protein PAN1 [Drosophila simulans]KMZ08805.1 uncharacterized protein Dsimw501_GD16108 [Drosophila simulans]
MSHQQQQFQHYHHHQHHIHQVQSESQLEQRSSDLEPNRSRNTDRIGSSMDFRNLCQRIDVDGLKAKLPQLKLPKSLPKLRGRKIFRSSKSGSNAAGGTAGGSSKDGAGAAQQSHLQVAGQSQQFINRTPQRISTISSLMYEGEQEEIRANLGRSQPGTYRSAGSLDDDYYAPGSGDRASRPISPIKIPVVGADDSSPSGNGNARTTLTQRLQRGYKSLSELRIKHIFAKQTTVRRDNIEVDRYVEQYERELKSEKLARERRDREIAENYDIKIKTLAGTRQNTFDDDDVEHEQFERGKMSHETDESGMEATPPLPSRRKPGIAATRFAKVRKPPLEMEEQQQATGDGAAAEESPRANPPPPRPSSYKQLLNKLPHLPSLPNLPQFSRSKEEPTKTGENADENNDSSKMSIRQNIKRLRKSIKRPSKIKPKAAAPAPDSDEEDQGDEVTPEGQKTKDAPTRSSTANLRARLSRFASTEQLQQRWRKSFKGGKEPKELETKAEGSATGGAAAAAAGASGVLGGLLVGSQLEKTLAKLNEKVHQLKFFQRNANNQNATTSQQPKPNTVGHEPVEIDDDELEATYHRSDSLEDENRNENDDSGEDISAEEAFGQIQEEDDEEDHSQDQAKRGHSPVSGVATAHAARQMAKLAEIQAASKSGAAAWSSESLEEIADEDYPRVLIHQEHSDAYESTLIIAVASKGSSVSPVIRSSGLKSSPAAGPKTSPHPEIRISASGPQSMSYSPRNPSGEPVTKRSPSPEFKTPAGGTKIPPSEASAWLPNEQIIAGFKEQTSWPAPALYKPKSIDIFEASAGGSAAFADFDEALRNAPVLRISAGSSIDTSVEEADDSCSRVTRIRVQSPQIGNSRESLMAQEEEDEEAERDSEEEQADEERDPSERPPSESPPPPPLPQRRPPPKRPATPPIYDAVPPPLPVSKPPPPPTAETIPSVAPVPSPAPVTRAIPQRSASMSRPAKPLVKTSSLRLTYNEQVRPGDVGKVNKLISRFEGGRPRLCPRRMHSEEYERSAQAEDEEPEMEQILELQIIERRAVDSVTPTNRAVVIPQITVNNNNERQLEQLDQSDHQEITDARKKKSMELALDRQNSNCSRSEYGSPLSFPSSRRSSTPTNLNANTNPNPNPSTNPSQNPSQILQHQRRSRRSMTRDDDNFYSFDSDEENSYYSISPSGSSRYVVEI